MSAGRRTASAADACLVGQRWTLRRRPIVEAAPSRLGLFSATQGVASRRRMLRRARPRRRAQRAGRALGSVPRFRHGGPGPLPRAPEQASTGRTARGRRRRRARGPGTADRTAQMGRRGRWNRAKTWGFPANLSNQSRRLWPRHKGAAWGTTHPSNSRTGKLPILDSAYSGHAGPGRRPGDRGAGPSAPSE